MTQKRCKVKAQKQLLLQLRQECSNPGFQKTSTILYTRLHKKQIFNFKRGFFIRGVILSILGI